MSFERVMLALLPAAALVATSVGSVQARPFAPLDRGLSNVETVAAKRAPGRCGPHMFWSAKERKCVDARTKTKSGSWKPF